MKKFMWKAHSDDGSYLEESRKFNSQEECYADMMSAALEKMKWNMDWDDVTSDTGASENPEGIVTAKDGIRYTLLAKPDMITHTSYSGKYTWEMFLLDLG